MPMSIQKPLQMLANLPNHKVNEFALYNAYKLQKLSCQIQTNALYWENDQTFGVHKTITKTNEQSKERKNRKIKQYHIKIFKEVS